MPVFLLVLTPFQDAPAGSGQPPGMLDSLMSGMLFPLLLCGIVFYFIVLRPEQKARKAKMAMLDAMKKGDRVLTSGGLYGSVVQVQEQIVTLQVDEGVRMRFARSAIASVLADDAVEADKKS